MNSSTNSQLPAIWMILIFIIIAGGIRLLLSDIPNIAPIAAIALMGGAYFRNRQLAFLIPLIVMFSTDALLQLAHQLGWREFSGFHAVMPFVYIGFILIVVIGLFLKNRVKPLPVLGAGILSSIVFFIVSNFGVWMTGGYPATLDGLIACYVAAIPFFHLTLAGDLFFIGVFFGAIEWLSSRKPAFASA